MMGARSTQTATVPRHASRTGVAEPEKIVVTTEDPNPSDALLAPAETTALKQLNSAPPSLGAAGKHRPGDRIRPVARTFQQRRSYNQTELRDSRPLIASPPDDHRNAGAPNFDGGRRRDVSKPPSRKGPTHDDHHRGAGVPRHQRSPLTGDYQNGLTTTEDIRQSEPTTTTSNHDPTNDETTDQSVDQTTSTAPERLVAVARQVVESCAVKC